MKLVLTTIIAGLLISSGLSAQANSQVEMDSALSYLEDLVDIEPDQAIVRSNRLMESGVKQGDSTLMADLLRIEALAYFRKNDFNTATKTLSEALNLYTSKKDSNGIVAALTGLAKIQVFTGNNYQALTRLERARDINLSLKNENHEIEIYYLLSKVRYNQGQQDLALKHALHGLNLATESNSKEQRGELYNLLAKIKLEQEDINKAKGYIDNARLIHRGLGKDAEVAETYATSALIAYKTGNLPRAEEEISQALKISKTFGYPYQYASHLLIYSRVLANADSTQKALSIAQLADSVLRHSPYIPQLSKDITHHLAMVNMSIGDSARALREWIAYQGIEDSIRDFDFQKLMLKREYENQIAENEELSQQNELNEQLIDRSKLLLLLASGLIVVFVLLIAALMQNITRKKKYGKHLLNKNEMIREKTEAIKDQQAELEEKNKKLEELDKTKNKIFSVLTHDLRQPITQVKSVLSLLEAEELSDDDRITMVGKLKESVDNSSNALENLLLWSKKQMTGITTKIVDIHLLPQVWQLESQVKPNLQAKNIKFKIKVPDFFKIQGDMNQLDICMRNLVNNSIKFSNPGGKITMEAFEEGDFKVIKVSDNGVGMDADQLNQLQSLSQSFSTIGTMNEKGTGLGILIVHEFMETQGGHLKITSEKGKGSQFSLYFPTKNENYSGRSK